MAQMRRFQFLSDQELYDLIEACVELLGSKGRPGELYVELCEERDVRTPDTVPLVIRMQVPYASH